MPKEFLSDLALSRRLEHAEGCAARRFVESRARFDPASGAQWFELAGASVLYDGPNSPATQTFGLGLWQVPSKEDMERIEGFFAERGATVFHEVSPIADPAMLPLLADRGYRPVELTTLLFQALEGRVRSETRVPVREARPDELDLWAETAAEGWRENIDLAGMLGGLMRVVMSAEGSRAYFAEIDGRPVATGALAMNNGVALLAGAATIPEWRHRGVQRSLLEHRLASAAEAGCELAVMGAAPGSASQRNAERSGFRIAYTRIKWARSA